MRTRVLTIFNNEMYVAVLDAHLARLATRGYERDSLVIAVDEDGHFVISKMEPDPDE